MTGLLLILAVSSIVASIMALVDVSGNYCVPGYRRAHPDAGRIELVLDRFVGFLLTPIPVGPFAPLLRLPLTLVACITVVLAGWCIGSYLIMRYVFHIVCPYSTPSHFIHTNSAAEFRIIARFPPNYIRHGFNTEQYTS